VTTEESPPERLFTQPGDGLNLSWSRRMHGVGGRNGLHARLDSHLGGAAPRFPQGLRLCCASVCGNSVGWTRRGGEGEGEIGGLPNIATFGAPPPPSPRLHLLCPPARASCKCRGTRQRTRPVLKSVDERLRGCSWGPTSGLLRKGRHTRGSRLRTNWQ
jgi:hypothetical protein